MVLHHAADYRGVEAMHQTSVTFCRAHGMEQMALFCLSCVAGTLMRTGEWDRAEAICRELMAADVQLPFTRAGIPMLFGSVHARRGDTTRARPFLAKADRLGRAGSFLVIQVDAAWAFALVEDADGAPAAAVEHCRRVLDIWSRSEDRIYATSPLWWAATLFGRAGTMADLGACCAALSQIAATGSTEALAALAHALGEYALQDGAPAVAVTQFERAVEFAGQLDLPLERALTHLRFGAALIAAGEPARGAEKLAEAHRIAHRLGARPLATRAAGELRELGQPVERLLGRRIAGRLERGGLSRRELEILAHVAQGRTNREIAQALVLSPRTVDMHVAGILGKLGARSRTEAARRAAERGLLHAQVGATDAHT